MDVTLEGKMDGIELAGEINKKMDVPIIYLTAHHDRETIDRIKSTQPSAYLVKPLQEYNLQTSIELALYNHSHQNLQSRNSDGFDNDYISGDHFFIKVKSQLKKVRVNEIQFFEASDNYSYLHLQEQKYLISTTLKGLEEKLEEFGFLRVHRSYVINIKAIDSIEEDVVVISGHHIPVGKTHRENFMKRIKLL
jgi:DNA-binding LytR/AlgR family response regulator